MKNYQKRNVFIFLININLVIHRLDRLTSGLVIIGKNKSIANKISQQIESHQVSKYYLAKVNGIFPTYEERVIKKQ